MSEYDAMFDNIFEAKQARLPPEDRIGKTWCSAMHDGYECTKQQGHTGDHCAHGRLGAIHHRWNDAGEVLHKEYDL